MVKEYVDELLESHCWQHIHMPEILVPFPLMIAQIHLSNHLHGHYSQCYFVHTQRRIQGENCMFALPQGWRSLLRGILDPPLIDKRTVSDTHSLITMPYLAIITSTELMIKLSPTSWKTIYCSISQVWLWRISFLLYVIWNSGIVNPVFKYAAAHFKFSFNFKVVLQEVPLGRTEIHKELPKFFLCTIPV